MCAAWVDSSGAPAAFFFAARGVLEVEDFFFLAMVSTASFENDFEPLTSPLRGLRVFGGFTQDCATLVLG
jgi:hypothetical protein